MINLGWFYLSFSQQVLHINVNKKKLLATKEIMKFTEGDSAWEIEGDPVMKIQYGRYI